MIRIFIIDPALEIPTPVSPDRVIASVNDYVADYDHIARYVHKGLDLKVIVSDKIVGRWLKIMAVKYGTEHIVIEELTPRRVFLDQTGILALPDEITDEQLLGSGLLDLKIPAFPGISFDDYILEMFFGNFLTLPSGLRRVGDIIESFETEQWQDALGRPLVRDIYQKRIRDLRKIFDSESRLAEKQLLDWLDLSPQVFARNIFALRVLAGYPIKLGERILGNGFGNLSKLNLDLRRVTPSIAGNEKMIDEVRLYLEREVSNIQEDTLSLLLKRVSGLLEIEFDAIQRLLASGKFAVTKGLVTKVQEKFRPLHSSPRISQVLADLDMLISKSPPPLPDPSWDIETWMNWATQDYLPYRYWLENTNRLNDEVGEFANAYAEWLNEHYGQILYHSDHMIWKSLLNLKEDIKIYSGPVLIVVIDNFNSKFYPDLRSRLQQNGYYEHQLEYCFSLLPSCTEVSKKSLITGHFAPFPETAYQNQVEKIWANRLSKKVRYLSGIADLREVTDRQHDIYFLNYMPLDITLHLSENHTGVSHAQTIRAYLDMLSQDVRSFAERIGAERELMVIITSDHGSTRIPKGIVNVIKGNFYRKKAEDEHHRYIAISDEELEKLPDNSKYDCYLFKKDVYNLPSNYLVARRLYRFLPTDDHAYIHGGLTPEETIVPMAVFKPVTVIPKRLSISLVGSSKLYIGTKLELDLEITNLNSYDCEGVVLDFIDTNLDAEKQNIGNIAKLKRINHTVIARCPRMADTSKKKLQMLVTFNFLGQPFDHPAEIPVDIINPAEAKFNLDEF